MSQPCLTLVISLFCRLLSAQLTSEDLPKRTMSFLHSMKIKCYTIKCWRKSSAIVLYIDNKLLFCNPFDIRKYPASLRVNIMA